MVDFTSAINMSIGNLYFFRTVFTAFFIFLNFVSEIFTKHNLARRQKLSCDDKNELCKNLCLSYILVISDS